MITDNMYHVIISYENFIRTTVLGNNHLDRLKLRHLVSGNNPISIMEFVDY